MKVVVYSKPRCVQCDATKRALAKQGVSYEEIDMSVDLEALEYVKSLGFAQAPVVVAEGESWAGFRPDKIKALQVAAAVATA